MGQAKRGIGLAGIVALSLAAGVVARTNASSYGGASGMLAQGMPAQRIEDAYEAHRRSLGASRIVERTLAPVLYGIGKELACLGAPSQAVPAQHVPLPPRPEPRMRQYA